MFSIFKRRKKVKIDDANPIIEEIEYLNSSMTEWKNDAIIFQIKGGKKVISSKNYNNGYVVHNYNITHKELSINDKPLYSIQGENYYCPTCQKMIEEGYGFKDKERIITNKIIKAQKKNIDLKESLSNLEPLLELFETGLYMITRMDVFPTDGEENFFWTETNKRKSYQATIDTFYENHFGGGYLKFLYPSESLSLLNEKKINEYIQNGDDFTGLVYYMEGMMGLLLDGHHRASAACLANKSIDALCLTKVEDYSCSSNNNESDQLWAFGSSFKLLELKKYSEIKKILLNENKQTYPLKEKNNLKNISNSYIDVNLYEALTRNSKLYNTFLEIRHLDEINFERLEYLWNHYDEDSLFEYEILLSALFKKYKKESYDYLVRIINDPNRIEFKERAFEYLLYYPYEQIEEILVQYIINKEYDKSDAIRKNIDKYLKNASKKNKKYNTYF